MLSKPLLCEALWCIVAVHLCGPLLPIRHLSAVAALSTGCWAGSCVHAIGEVPSCIVVPHKSMCDYTIYLHPNLYVGPAMGDTTCKHQHIRRLHVLSQVDAPVPGLGVLPLADTNGLTDGMPGGSPG